MPTPTLPFFDYHSHHDRCGHAVGGMMGYIDAARGLGMTEFGVSDHGPCYWRDGDHAQPGTQMANSELVRYVAEACALRADYAGRGFTLKVGIEADFIEGREEELKTLLDTHPFDYALGSVHYAAGASIFKRDRWAADRAEDVFTDYYRQVALAARSGLFDILSHLTAVEAYSPPISDALADTLYRPAADAVAASGCIVEINTSGYRKMGGDEPFPNRRMLRLLIERGVPLTFGSDCHKPEEVGFARERVAALLGEMGLTARPPEPVTIRRGTLLAYRTG